MSTVLDDCDGWAYDERCTCPRCSDHRREVVGGIEAKFAEQVKETLQVPVEKGATKFDGNKVPVVSGALQYFPRALMAIAMDSEYGFRKYGAWGGWRGVPDGVRRYTDADGRHLLAEAIEGPYDIESGIAHAVMHAWDAMARVEKLLEDREIEMRRGNEIGDDGKPIPGTHKLIEF